MSEVDVELLQNFLEEADEMVTEVESSSTALESDPSDFKNIHSIFRAVHSLKGNSSFFDLKNIQSFCHSFENYLDQIREKKLDVTVQAVKLILEGSDHLKMIFGRLHPDDLLVELNDEENQFLEALNSQINISSGEEMIEMARAELVKYFDKAKKSGSMDDDSQAYEIYELLQTTAPALVKDKRKSASGLANEAKWFYKGLDVSREYNDLQIFLNEAKVNFGLDNAYIRFMSSVNSLIAKHMEAEEDDAFNILEDMKDDFEMFYQEEIGIDENMQENMREALEKYSLNIIEVKPEVKKKIQESKDDSKSSKDQTPQSKSMRIDEGLLDEFMDHIGELININELFNFMQRRLESGVMKNLVIDFKNTNQAFHELSNQLQKSLYEIRKAPVDRALSKLPRVLRGVAKNNGKSIELVMTGGDTEVDKSLMGIIETMLVHSIRNSADHGIEPAEERLASEKHREGKIMIDVYSDKNILHIKVADDGRGVNTEKVLASAISKGLVSSQAAQDLTDKEILKFLVHPGFSTAEEVTETSGRGVGMDVLASSVREMSGDMELQNRPGKGLTIDISLPMAYTTKVKLGLTMRVGSSIFLIPAENVRESFKASNEDINLVEGKGEVVQRWGQIYPLLRLSDLLNITQDIEHPWEGICILAEYKNNAVALLVDDILGQRQIVYKDLTVQTKEPSAFEGVSILDGRSMALILNVDGIIKQFME